MKRRAESEEEHNSESRAGSAQRAAFLLTLFGIIGNPQLKLLLTFLLHLCQVTVDEDCSGQMYFQLHISPDLDFCEDSL